MLRIPQLKLKERYKSFKLDYSNGRRGAEIIFKDLMYKNTILYSIGVYENHNSPDGNPIKIGTIPKTYFPVNPRSGKHINPNISMTGTDYLGHTGGLVIMDYVVYANLKTISHHAGQMLVSFNEKLKDIEVLRESNFFDNTSIKIII